jgi:uncharacterized protein
MIGGLPGTGKSTLAKALAERACLCPIHTDQVRKELAGLPAHAPARSPFGEGIYAPEWTERSYGECLRRAERLLFEGKRVVVDARFGEEKRRRAFVEAAARSAVPATFILCRADPQEAQLRLDRRQGDVSDADRLVYQEVAECWEAIGADTRGILRELDTGGTTDVALARAVEWLRELSLLD